MCETVYNELDANNRQIRLLQVFPPVGTRDEVRCSLEIVSLDDKPVYQALSYAWGDPSVQGSILLQGQPFLVTTNLQSALSSFTQRLRNASSPAKLWVDAVCINQQNLDEKSKQLQLMGLIYKNAEATIVWLGPSADESHIAFKAIERLARLVFAHDVYKYTSWPSDPIDQAKISAALQGVTIGQDESHDIPLQCLRALFERSWWHRVWTFQEIALATEIVVFCGCDSFDWVWLGMAILALQYRPRTLAMPGGPDLESVVNTLVSANDACSGFYDKVSKPTLITVLDHVVRSQRKCSDPCDYIYGLLGMVEDTQAEQIESSYELTPVQVFTNVAKFLLQTYGSGMLSYCHATARPLASTANQQAPRTIEGPFGQTYSLGNNPSSYTENQELSNLPSWVPNWHKGVLGPLQGPMGRNDPTIQFHAPKSLHSEEFDLDAVPLTFNDTSITVHGITVDVVQELMPLQPSSDSGQNEMKIWFRKILGYLLESKVYTSEAAKVETLWRTPCADKILHDDLANYRRMISSDRHGFEFIMGMPSPAAKSLTEEQSNHELRKYNEALLTWRHEWRLYVTSKGYLGVGPASIDIGDSLCILPGAGVPYVLRQDEKGQHRLVGETYIHGVMEGEIKPAPAEVKQFEIF